MVRSRHFWIPNAFDLLPSVKILLRFLRIERRKILTKSHQKRVLPIKFFFCHFTIGRSFTFKRIKIKLLLINSGHLFALNKAIIERFVIEDGI